MAGAHFVGHAVSPNTDACWAGVDVGGNHKGFHVAVLDADSLIVGPENVKPPLGQFNGTEMTKEGILEVLKSLNELCSHRVPDVAEACERNWPALVP